MIKEIICAFLIYVVITTILIVMDYWNTEQLSHILFFDLTWGLIGSIAYLCIISHLDKTNEPKKENQK